jgi:RNA recognition motif-containing protein
LYREPESAEPSHRLGLARWTPFLKDFSIRPERTPTNPPPFFRPLPPGHTLGDRNLTVREDNAPTKTANSGGGSKSGGGRGSGNVMGETPAAEGCRCYIGNLAWETTAESLVGAFEDYRPRLAAGAGFRRAKARDRDGGDGAVVVVVASFALFFFLLPGWSGVSSAERVFFFFHLSGAGNWRPLFSLFSTTTAHFSSVGSVVNAEVAKQPGGRSKGWGLVDFESPAAAESAIATLHNSDLQGRSVIVRLERAGGATKGPGGGANAGRPEASSGLQIVVRNLPWTTTSEDLRQVFQQVGDVVKADAVCHADTGRSKGWGTVLFETREQAQAAIQGFNGVELESRPMQIKLDRYD